jgi:toxin FitB
VASVTRIEVYGFTELKADEKASLDIIFGRLTILRLDDSVIKHAIALRQEKKMTLADSIIAATALAYNLPLVTRNVDDFEHIPNLKLLNPFRPDNGKRPDQT